MSRAWIITEDLITPVTATEDSAVGITGPRNAPDLLLGILKRDGGYVFEMRDDDGILYYRGRATWDIDSDDEDGAYGPLGDFGMPNAGCTSISYPKHPEFDCA